MSPAWTVSVAVIGGGAQVGDDRSGRAQVRVRALTRPRLVRCSRLGVAAAAAATILSCAVLAAPAGASEVSTIIERCEHEQPLSGFSENAYRQALKQLSTFLQAYSPCPELIGKAELAAATGGGTSASAAAANVPLALSPAEQHEVERAHHAGAAPVKVGNTSVTPGVVHADITSATSKLPTSLQVVLALLIAGGLAMAGMEMLGRVRARRHS